MILACSGLPINREPPTIDSKATISEAIAKAAKGAGYVVVLEGEKFKMLLTEAQLLKSCQYPQNNSISAVIDPTTSAQLTLTESEIADSHQVLSLLRKHDTSYLAVLDHKGNLRGVITETELLRSIYNTCYIAEAQARAYQQFAQKVIETSPNILYVHDLVKQCKVYVNSRVKDILGYTSEEFKYLANCVDIVHPEEQSYVQEFYKNCETLEENETSEAEFRIKHADGTWIWFSTRHTPFKRNADGLVVQTLGMAENITCRKQIALALQKHNEDLETHIGDRTTALRKSNQELLGEITERKLAEVALQEGEEKFRHIFEDAPIGMSVFGLDGKYLQVNHAFCHLLEYTESELKKLTAFETTYPEDIPRERSLIKQVLRGEISDYRLEKRLLKRNREILWVHLTSAVIRDSRSGVIRYGIAMVEDISDRKKTEEALRQSEERFRKIFEEGPLGMAVMGFNQRVINVNAMLCEMLGYKELEIINMPFHKLSHPDDIDADLQLSKQLYYGRIANYQIEKRYLKKNQEVIWVSLTASVIKDKQGRTIHTLAMVKNITKQKEARDLIAASLRGKEILLKEVHHRVKNNLHVIANLLDLQSQFTEDEEILKLFSDSQNRIHSMALIHEQLCLSPRLEQIDFDEYIRSLVANLFTSYGIDHNQIKCAVEVAPVTLGLETAIPCGLILNELISNSLKYAFPQGRKGEVRVQLHYCKEYEQNIEKIDAKLSHRLLNLIISDNGVGMAANIDWLHTNSLGLRLVRILTRQLDGTIELEQEQGTTFCLTFAELEHR